ncbi:hypothetical protein CDD83_10235 [Cordyceps sp. RAO-2017]|nr:hypothetical protein CDD83_10235 [Cordyceps sp. RAO-2017]
MDISAETQAREPGRSRSQDQRSGHASHFPAALPAFVRHDRRGRRHVLFSACVTTVSEAIHTCGLQVASMPWATKRFDLEREDAFTVGTNSRNTLHGHEESWAGVQPGRGAKQPSLSRADAGPEWTGVWAQRRQIPR